ncbi:MAG: hypothetical protein WA628_05000 [Terriglobales bacterium]
MNPKYPSDVAYYIKNMLKIDLKTVGTANGTLHMTPERHAVYFGINILDTQDCRTGSMTAAFVFIGACYVLASCIVPAIKIGSSVSQVMPILLTQEKMPDCGNNAIC